MLAARNGKNVYENQVNMIKNAKAHRNKITIRDIFANYWSKFVNMCNAKGKI